MTRNLARRDGLPGDVAAHESLSEHETVLVIHGTFANKAEPAPNWWLRDGDFCRKLDVSLSKRGSPARCWAHVSGEENVFAWTGANRESGRRIGGDGLAKEIAELDVSHDINRYHIIAHSHGGNVVLHALRALADDPKKLGKVIFLGTPVLRFPRLNRSVAVMCFLGIALVSSVAMALHNGEFRQLSAGKHASFSGDYDIIVKSLPIWSSAALAFGLLLLVEWWRKRRRRGLYGSRCAHAFEFNHDEAIIALKGAMQIAKQPKRFLKEIFGTKKPPSNAVPPPRRKFWDAVLLEFKKTTTYQLLQDFPLKEKNPVKQFKELWRMARRGNPLAMCTFGGSIIGLLGWSYFIMAVAEPDLVAKITAILRTLGPSFALLFAVVAFMLVVAALVTLIMGPIIFVFMLLLSALVKVVGIGLSQAIDLILQGPGAWIMGRVIRNAAFGGQCKEVLRPQELPEKDQAYSEPISESLQEKMNDLSNKTAAMTGAALYSVFAEGDAMTMKEHILARLADPKLAHCQYYCEDEIIGRIAELIAPKMAAS